MCSELACVETLLRIMSRITVHVCLSERCSAHMEQAEAWRWLGQFQSGFKSRLYGRRTIKKKG